jgi:pyruvate dehydrogenase E2 component (dihydrolipoamide acetyltransferase)
MPIEVKLPELGENVEKGDVVRVLVAEGDVIKIDQPVLELETDKATIEVPSSAAGKVTGISVKAGDKVKVGQVVLVLENGSGAPAAEAPAPAAAAAPAPPAAPAKAKQETKPEPAPQAAPAPAPPAPETVRPATRPAPVVDITSGRSVSTAEAAAAARAELGTARPDRAATEAAAVPAAPSVRRYARELGVEIDRVAGTGPGGRIGQDDVKAHAKAAIAGGGGRTTGAAAPDLGRYGPIESRPMSNIRRKTAEHLTTAWQAPHVTQHDKADVSALEEFRRIHGARVEQAGGKLTVTAVTIKVVAAAIGRYPQFASALDLTHNAIIYRQYCHIGVAVDTPGGLLVPVIRDADRKTITEIAVELAALSKKARDKKLSLEEMAGSVLSITNLGGLGGTSFTPIVNYPEVAILGLSRTAIEPVYRDGQFVPRPMLPLSLSYDHRAIDGADAVRFLRFVVEALEQPLSMYL